MPRSLVRAGKGNVDHSTSSKNTVEHPFWILEIIFGKYSTLVIREVVLEFMFGVRARLVWQENDFG